MSPSIPEGDWPRLLPLVEQALDLPASERQAWAQGLDLPAPLAATLRALLEDRLAVEADDFMAALPPLSERAASAKQRFVEGARVGPWQLQRELGQGGMSVVWLARRTDGQVERTVAIKLPHAGPGQDLLARRMRRERKILAALEHPHIARLYDVGVTDEGTPYLVMEFVSGSNLLAHADAQGLDIRARVALFQQVLAAVQYAHGRLVLHRDLKPSNILVGADGQVKLLDFGIAKLMTGDGDTDNRGLTTELTRGELRQLTPSYASPEQIQGQPLGIASDVYSLGVILYELLCGSRPHSRTVQGAGWALQLEAAELNEAAKPPSRRQPDSALLQARSTTSKSLALALRGDLDAFVLKALELQPPQRYATAEALSADLQRWLNGETVSARGPGFWYPVSKFVRRHRLSLGLGGLALTVLLTTGTVALWQSRMAKHEAERAAAARDFMLQLFDEADPNKLGGLELSTAQRLELGRLKAEARLGDNGSLQAEFLAGIGQAQYKVREMVSADAALSKAADFFRSRGERAREADARITRLRIAAEEQDDDTMGSRLQDVEDLQSTIAKDPVLRVRGLVARSLLGIVSGNSEAVRTLLDECVAVADLADPKQAAAAFEAHVLLASSYAWMGLMEKSKSHLRSAMQVPLVDKELSAQERSLRLLQAALAPEVVGGNPASAAQHLPTIVSNCEAGFGSRSLRCAPSKARLLMAHLVRGDIAKMQPLLAEGDDYLRRNLSPYGRLVAALSLSRALAYSGVTDLSRLPYVKLEEAVADNALPRISVSKRLPGLVTLAEVRLRAGDPVAAANLLDRAARVAEQATGERERAESHIRLGRGLILQATGKNAEAIELLKPLCELTGEGADAQLERLNCVRPLALIHQNDRAVRIVQEALPILARDLGDDAPHTERARQLLRALQSPAGWRPPPWDASQIFLAF